MARWLRSQWRARRGQPTVSRMVPALLCALSILSLALSACANVVLGSPTPTPPYRCYYSGDAPPPDMSYRLTVASPVAADGVVYAVYAVPGAFPHSGEARIAALRESDGALLWSVADTNGTAHLAYADGILLLLGRGIVGLRASDGTALWRALPWHTYGIASSVIGGGVLYVIHIAVYAFRITDGRLLWQTPEQDGQWLNALVADGATVYVGSGKGFVIALRADTGALLWKTFLTYPAPATLPTPPAATEYTPFGVVAGQLYVRATGAETVGILQLHAADGASAVYNLPISITTRLEASPVLIVNGTLYVGVASTTSMVRAPTELVAYRLLANGGKFLWRLSANGSVLTIMAHDAQTLYLQGVTSGVTYAVDLVDGAVLWRQHTALGPPADTDAATGELFETAPGVADPCHPRVNQAPRIGSFKGADGSALWTRALDATH